MAGMAAATGQKAVIFAPKNAPQAKVAQLLIFGAQVILVDGTYDDAFDLTVKAANEFGWYCRNTGYNPFTLEGKKTAAFEIWEWWIEAHREWHKKDSALDDHPPLTIFVSVGDGNIISGIHKGFKDLLALGWIPNLPRIIGARASFDARTSRLRVPISEAEMTTLVAKAIADGAGAGLPFPVVGAQVAIEKEFVEVFATVRRDGGETVLRLRLVPSVEAGDLSFAVREVMLGGSTMTRS